MGGVLAPLGLQLAPEKTRVVHIDEGFDWDMSMTSQFQNGGSTGLTPCSVSQLTTSG
ncbi:MAG TPA: hypothetical protein VGD71_16310 [Kribbella sp.]